jgi:uncharacterized protein (DUF1697 family)
MPATTWVALLRGVNVGGITIRSAELKALFEEQGYGDVRTVLASGNVVFTASTGVRGRSTLKASIEKALRDRFGYDAWIVLVTAAEVQKAIDAFPFDTDDASRQPWVLFCVDDDTRDELLDAAKPLDAATDPVGKGPGVVYWSPPKGSTTDTPFAKVIGKQTYRTRTTNRNVRTLLKILG